MRDPISVFIADPVVSDLVFKVYLVGHGINLHDLVACAEPISSIYSNLVSERNEEVFQALTTYQFSIQRKRQKNDY